MTSPSIVLRCGGRGHAIISESNTVAALIPYTGHGGRVSLAGALLTMATRTEPGGMCQHTFDNVGTLYSTCAAIAVLRNVGIA